MNVHHYTTRHIADAIRQSGTILPATAYVPPGEFPIVWFSRAKTWEPTASKAVANESGHTRVLTFPEMVKVGIARFTVDAASLLPWPDLWRTANMEHTMALALERTARKQGANPRDWFGSVEPVALSCVLRVEYFDRARNTWGDFGMPCEVAA